MRKILVVGATGLTGQGLTKGLLAAGFDVRASARNVERAKTILPAECEIVRGDISEPASMSAATKDVEAVYLCIHTLGPQPGAPAGQDFVATELEGLRNVIAACKANGVRRIFHVTFLGLGPDTKGITNWARGRWEAEQLLINSGIDATIFRPGQIVGKGGFGFDTMMKQAKGSIAFVMGKGTSKHQNIALGDLVYYLIAALDEPRTYNQAFDVGSDDVLTGDEMIDVAARVLGKGPPTKIHVPLPILRLAAPLIERAAKMPKGAFNDLLDGSDADLVGDVARVRAILPRPPLRYEEAVTAALKSSG